MEQAAMPSFENTETAFAYKSGRQLRKAALIFSVMQKSWLVKAGTAILPFALKAGLPVRGLIRNTLFAQFCGGESLEEAALTARRLERFNTDVILDYGVEAAEGEENYDRAVPEFTRAVGYAAQQSNIPFISLKVTGFARNGLLEKLHLGQALQGSEEDEWQRVQERIRKICAAAAEHHIGVLIDAEESWIQQPVDELAESMMAQFNAQRAIVYNTFQLYRHDRLEVLHHSFEKARAHHYILGAKLVRGAYMEKERKRAEEMNEPSPIQASKEDTDRDYDAAVRFCLDHLDNIATFIGTHNEKSCLLAVEYMKEKNIPHDHPHVHFSQLFGMSDHITFNLAQAGYHASKYLPYGPVKDVMPYLIRRAQENTSIAGQTGRELSLLRRERRRRQV